MLPIARPALIRLACAALMTLMLVLAAACDGSGGSASPTAQGFVPAPQTQQTATTAPSPTPNPTPSPSPTPDVLATARAEGCQVTAYASGGTPSGLVGQTPLYPSWYGTGNLWLAPSSFQAGSGLQPVPSQTIWYAGQVPVFVLSPGTPKISGHLLSEPSATLTVNKATNAPTLPARPPSNPYYLDFDFPQAGCWQIDVVSGNATLKVVAWVLPHDQRPDVARMLQNLKQLTPFSVPASCKVTPWVGPMDVAPYQAEYQIAGQGMSADTQQPVFFAGTEGLIELTPKDQSAPQPTLSGHANIMPAVPLRSSIIERGGESGTTWAATVIFTAPGCWQIQATAGSASLSAMIYVYPAECARQPGTPLPSGCKLPGSPTP